MIRIVQLQECKLVQDKRYSHAGSGMNRSDQVCYNILRAIGQLGLVDGETPVRRPTKQRWIKTVIQEPM